jgi:hypothetical protein
MWLYLGGYREEIRYNSGINANQGLESGEWWCIKGGDGESRAC